MFCKIIQQLKPAIFKGNAVRPMFIKSKGKVLSQSSTGGQKKIKIQNYLSRSLKIRLNSGNSIRIAAGWTSDPLAEEEIENNIDVNRLILQDAIVIRPSDEEDNNEPEKKPGKKTK